MPIYAYRCSTCGHAKDVLQKMSDPLLTVCPECGEPTFLKQVTAAGFQLKGSGWYVTDFKGGNKPAPAGDKGNEGDKAPADKPEGPETGAKKDPAKSEAAKSDAAPATSPPVAPKGEKAAPAPPPPAAPPAAGSK